MPDKHYKTFCLATALICLVTAISCLTEGRLLPAVLFTAVGILFAYLCTSDEDDDDF